LSIIFKTGVQSDSMPGWIWTTPASQRNDLLRREVRLYFVLNSQIPVELSARPLASDGAGG
jgi:hypothetical protein